MEAGEENGNNMGLKRQRAPLSDSEDNNCSAPETNDSQKRRRVEAAGQENHCPEASSSGRRAELETKPDTPIVPSVRSRVQQLTQRRDGGAPPAQRCLSDPGGDSKGHKEPLLGEAEFNQRMERFKMASFQSSPTNTPSPANQYPRTRSSFVSVIQQKLQGSTTPSSKQVSRIRQEREHELSQVPFQPIAENAWLKRSSSDSALAEERTPCGPSGPSSSVPRSKRRVQWPPTCLWDDQGVADVKDGSFTEPPTTNADSASLNMTGEMTSGHSEAPAAYSETGMQKRCVLSEEPRQTQEALSANEEEQPGPQQPEGQTVLKLSFSEDHSFFKAPSDTEVSFRDETNTGEIIDQMFEEVLEYAERMEGPEDHDSGIGACSVENDKMETEKEKSEEEGEAKEEKSDESDKVDGIRDELLNFPPTGILSPLSKSVEAVVTPLRLAASQEPIPPLLLTPDETSAHPAESAPLYSIDAYRTQRQSKLPIVQSVTPGVQRRAEETPKPQPPVNIKEKITALNEEAGKLQTVINQTLQALNCCTDEEHGRGSLEEAEAEKLLLVSCEKRSALLAEVARLKEERSSESGEAAVEDSESISQQPCRGTVSITNIQLPLKVEYVCSSHNRAGRPSHYFFVLIRYGPCNIVATPLATAADAQNGDTISFPTSVTMKDIRSSFEIDVEVYSLSQTSASNCTMERASTKPRVTPRKLLNTLTQRSSVSSTSAAPPLITRRSSNFCLVGSHKIALASLGHSKFPLDKMKLDGKVRRLLGDEFQEKVPFLSPLEGNIYLQLESKSHSDVQHQGFLTMFELISGYGVWHRRFFVLEECNLYYWNYPNDRETKEAEGSISLSSSQSQCVRPVKRELCARPFTFELVSSVSQQEQDLSQDAAAKCWFSADTKQERLDWMEKLNQALLDFHTWNRTQTESQQANTSSSGNLRESIL
ncbi:anillin, actin binding protein 2 isoform X6 [Pundamilia nyererei]|uniref:Anillin, actin binding protein 2 isoform X6 n=1 Tax=Pundamilia nyererei TaxID=303518 RepID=A0A9Y3RYD3_9CICH|nr:PREDICTED: actin-binding protein anillin-like isoform X6 [Pundamilia nyererei]